MISDVIEIRLQELLKTKEKSLYRVAKDTNLAYNALLKIKNGEVTDVRLTTIEKLCASLNCSITDLVKFTKP